MFDLLQARGHPVRLSAIRDQQPGVRFAKQHLITENIEIPRIDTKSTQGTGCTLRAIITAELAKDQVVRDLFPFFCWF